MRPTRSLPMRQRAAARDAPSPIAVLGSPLRDGSRGGCGARPALLPRLLLFLLLLRAPVRPSRSAHGKRPPPRAAARPPAREGPPARPRRRTPGAQGGGLGPRRVGRSARAGHGPAARVTGPPSCRAWRGRDPGATRRGGRQSGGPHGPGRPASASARRHTAAQARPSVALSSAGLRSQEATPPRSFVPCPRVCGGDPTSSQHKPTLLFKQEPNPLQWRPR